MEEVEMVNMVGLDAPPLPMDLNKLQKKMVKYLLGFSDLRQGTAQDREALYFMLREGVLDRGISFEETKERLNAFGVKYGLDQFCEAGRSKFAYGVRSEAKKQKAAEVREIVALSREFRPIPACECQGCQQWRRDHEAQRET